MATSIFEQGAVLRQRADRRIVTVLGTDRVDYLQRMLSQDIVALEPGSAADACVLTPQGKLVGMPTVLHGGEVHLMDLDDATVADVVARLERTVITEDVSFLVRDDETERFTLAGAGAGERLGALLASPPGPGCHVLTRGLGVLRRDLGRVPAYELFLDAGSRDEILDALSPFGVVERDDWDALRVAERIPAWGAELGPEVMPLEVRLGDTAISFAKGCFPGQEPVAMAHHRGHPANLLVRVALTGGAPEAGTPLEADGRGAGRLTTIAGDRALALVRWDRVEEGAELALEGGGTARLLDGR